jgi:hypothetical protein
MKRVLKWLLIVLVLLGAIAAGAVYAGVQLADRKMARVLTLSDYPLAIPTDAAAIERGRYLYNTRGCADCHGANGGGADLVNDGKGFHIKGPNRHMARGARGGRALRARPGGPCLTPQLRSRSWGPQPPRSSDGPRPWGLAGAPAKPQGPICA